MRFRIESISAYLCVGEDDEEGIIGAPIGPNGEMIPLVAADEDRLQEIKPVALEIAASLGWHVKLVRFSHREEIADLQEEAKSGKA